MRIDEKLCPECERPTRSAKVCARCAAASGAYWVTCHELDFIRSGADRLRTEAVSFLRGYLMGARLRTDWGGIDRERVMEFAERQLALRVAEAAA